MLYSVLKKIKFNGTLEIIDSENKNHVFGNNGSLVKVKFTTKLIEKKLFHNPSLYLGEGYMNEEILIQEGTIEQFIDIVTASYDDFINQNYLYKFYENISSFFKPIQQINKLVKSKKNIAHHYDLNEDLYRLFLDKDMHYSCAYFQNPNLSLDQAQIDKKKSHY